MNNENKLPAIGKASLIERLARINLTLSAQYPIDKDTPILIVCKQEVRLRWINAAREVGLAASHRIDCIDLQGLENSIQDIVASRKIVIVDDVYPDQRPRLKAIVKAFGESKIAHRFFMTADLNVIQALRK